MGYDDMLGHYHDITTILHTTISWDVYTTNNQILFSGANRVANSNVTTGRGRTMVLGNRYMTCHILWVWVGIGWLGNPGLSDVNIRYKHQMCNWIIKFAWIYPPHMPVSTLHGCFCRNCLSPRFSLYIYIIMIIILIVIIIIINNNIYIYTYISQFCPHYMYLYIYNYIYIHVSLYPISPSYPHDIMSPSCLVSSPIHDIVFANHVTWYSFILGKL